jgi:excisionase family DNA binding protein
MNIAEVKKKVPLGATRADAVPHDAQRLTVSVEEAGRILGISRGAAYARAGDGTIPVVRLGRRLVVPLRALEKLLHID